MQERASVQERRMHSSWRGRPACRWGRSPMPRHRYLRRGRAAPGPGLLARLSKTDASQALDSQERAESAEQNLPLRTARARPPSAKRGANSAIAASPSKRPPSVASASVASSCAQLSGSAGCPRPGSPSAAAPGGPSAAAGSRCGCRCAPGALQGLTDHRCIRSVQRSRAGAAAAARRRPEHPNRRPAWTRCRRSP